MITPETYAELEQIAARYPQARSGLLPMLHLVQSAEGRVTSEGIEVCAEILGISERVLRYRLRKYGLSG